MVPSFLWFSKGSSNYWKNLKRVKFQVEALGKGTPADAIGWFKTELIIVMCPLQIDKSLHLKYIYCAHWSILNL